MVSIFEKCAAAFGESVIQVGQCLVTWSPDLGAERVYRALGAKGLGSAAGEAHGGTVWEIVTEETKGDYRFFKVVVEMP